VRIVSPDWSGEKTGEAKTHDGKLVVTIPELEAYAVALLSYDRLPATPAIGRRLVPMMDWSRPAKNEFVVQPNGVIRPQWALNGVLQGDLHAEMRNPPNFLVNMPHGGSLRAQVRAVATQGARLECLIDDKLIQSIDLPDRDHKNDTSAHEYDQTCEFPIPAGRHRVTLRNTGKDWLTVGWLAFLGEVAE
jgi:hypothetical protein